MKKNISILAFFIIFSAMMVFGCVARGDDSYGEMWASQVSNYVGLYSEEDMMLCQEADCWAMVCTKTPSLWRVEDSFVGGSCHFENLAGPTHIENPAERYAAARNRFNRLNSVDGGDEVIRSFMVGAGTGFSDFGEANRWCNNGMKLAVQWLVGTQDRPYTDIDAGRAICFLDKGIMPMYVLYSGGNLDSSNRREYAERTEEIAHSLGNDGSSLLAGRLDGPVGPVIITTDMEADLTDDETYEFVVQQITNIKASDNCPDSGSEKHCLVAVGLKMNDYAGARKILADERVASKIDLVAFGMNSRYVDSCDQNQVYSDAWDFSRFVWHEFHKPTVIPYILFDSAGSITDDQGNHVCDWTESEMLDGYSHFFPNLPAFVDSGTIGAAIYNFNSSEFGLRSDPLECEDCSLGSSDERLVSWFSGCQRYTTIERLDPEVGGAQQTRSGGGQQLVFANAAGGRCNFQLQDDSILNTPYGSEDWRDFGTPVTGDLEPPLLDEAVIRCDTCIIEWDGWPAEGIPSSSLSPANTERACTAFPELDDWAGRRNLDPVFVRALAWHESGMDPCAVSCVARSTTTGEGGTLEDIRGDDEDSGISVVGVGGRTCWTAENAKYSAGYNFMEDPSGLCDLGTQPSPSEPGANANFRWLALGLMQVMNSPYTFWPSDTPQNYCEGAEELNADPACGIYAEHFRDAVLTRASGTGSERRAADRPSEAIAECGPVFNPFNTTHSACMGTYIFRQKLDAASAFVSNNLRYLRIDNPSERKLLEYYIATWMYVGNWDDTGSFSRWALDYSVSSHITDEFCQKSFEDTGYVPGQCMQLASGEVVRRPCYGTPDFITYVHECKAIGNDPGYNKLTIYRYLNGACHDYSGMRCPSWRNVQEEMEMDVPECGNPYLCPEVEEEDDDDSDG